MSKRIQRVNQLIKEEISKIFLKEIDFPKDILVTVTRVETSPDLNQAKIFVSCIPDSRRPKTVENLNKIVSLVQKKIGEHISIKTTPKLKFIEEKEIQGAARVEAILEELKNKKS